MVALACLLGVVFALFGVSNLIRHNAHLLELSEIKLDVLTNLDRLNEIQHQHARYYLEDNQAIDVADLNKQFTEQISKAKENLSVRFSSNFDAIERAWASIAVLEKVDASTRSLFDAKNQQLVSHLVVLKQTALSFITENQEDTRLSIHIAIVTTVLCSGLGMSLGALLMMRQAKRISRSLIDLGRGMGKAAIGDLSKRVDIKGSTEVEALSEGFNYMIAELEKKSIEASNHQKSLLAVMNSAPDAIITTDMDGIVYTWNRACKHLFIYTWNEIADKKFQTILEPNQQADFNNILKQIRDSQKKGQDEPEGPWELSVRRKDGIHIPIEISIRVMLVDADKKLVIVGRDITERKATEEKMAFLTQHDILTHLPNRTLIREKLVQSMNRAEAAEQLVGVISMGIDRFSDINDSIGHTLADGLLLSLAEQVNEMLSRRDHFGRLGGDEFCIVLENIHNVDEASALTDKIAMKLAEPFDLGGHEVFVTASFGIAVYPFDDESPEALLKHASAAMSRCKKDDSASFLFYSRQMNSSSCGRAKMTSELRKAISSDQFVLHYQPQYSVETNKIVGAEVLLRWKHPELGILEPNTFISVLEESGLIVPVSDWVMASLAKNILEWNKIGPYRISANLSSRQLRDELSFSKLCIQIKQLKVNLFEAGLIDDIEADIQNFLELELTESLLMENTELSQKMLYTLKEMGVKLSVDDFGTGYSSLSYLQQFPLDALKIDQTFVAGIGQDQGAELIVRAIIDLAHNLDLSVVGEGVESQQQLDFLREKNCEEVQGYLFSSPLSEAKYEKLIYAESGVTIEENDAEAKSGQLVEAVD